MTLQVAPLHAYCRICKAVKPIGFFQRFDGWAWTFCAACNFVTQGYATGYWKGIGPIAPQVEVWEN